MFKALFRAINQWLHRFFIKKPKVASAAPKPLSLEQAVLNLQKNNDAPLKTQDKDLKDLTETPNCGPWSITKHHCPDCEKTITWDEWIKDFCQSCGTFGRKGLNERSWRKVIHGGKWKFQLRYKNGQSKVVDKVP